jgi:hypothetical protein
MGWANLGGGRGLGRDDGKQETERFFFRLTLSISEVQNGRPRRSDPVPATETTRVTVTKISSRKQILRPLMVTSDDLMAIDAPVGSDSARWVTTQLIAVGNGMSRGSSPNPGCEARRAGAATAVGRRAQCFWMNEDCQLRSLPASAKRRRRWLLSLWYTTETARCTNGSATMALPPASWKRRHAAEFGRRGLDVVESSVALLIHLNSSRSAIR